MSDTYPEPVSNLIALGETDWDEWDDYSKFGFTKEHIPELIRLGTDRFLLSANEEVGDDEMWAPMHAWRALVQLQAADAIAALTQILDWSFDTDSDLITEGFTDVLEKFGTSAIEPLAAFINERGHSVSGYTSASEVMGRIGIQHPEQRDRVVQIITSALDARFEHNDEDVNSFWIVDLLDLKAVESYPVIKKAFDAKKVNLRVAGDLEDVEIEFGMRKERETPPPNKPLPFDFMRSREDDIGIPRDEAKKFEKKAKKEKNKRKQEKKSRKKNRKRK